MYGLLKEWRNFEPHVRFPSTEVSGEAAALLVIAKKIEEQTEVMKELIKEIVALTNQR